MIKLNNMKVKDVLRGGTHERDAPENQGVVGEGARVMSINLFRKVNRGAGRPGLGGVRQ